MNSETLRIFAAVAAELSITRAAARLGRAPSNVTTRIQQLESDLGTELFVRTGKRLSLSPAGERLVDYGARMLALEDEARQVVSGGRHAGVLRLGSMESTAAVRLPAILTAFHQKQPATRMQLQTGPSMPLLEQVRNGQLDCAFVALPADFGGVEGLADLGLQARAVWREQLLLAMPPGALAGGDIEHLAIRSLAAFPQGCTYRGVAEALLGVHGSTEWRVQEMASYHAMIACVAAGACVTLLPESVLNLSPAREQLQTWPAGPADTLLVWRERSCTPALEQLLALLPEVADGADA